MDMLKSSMKTKCTDKAASMYVALECLRVSISIPIYVVSCTILLMLLKHYSRKGSISFRTRDSVSVGSHSPHSWSPESKQTAAPRTGFAMCSPHQEFPTGPQFSPSSACSQPALSPSVSAGNCSVPTVGAALGGQVNVGLTPERPWRHVLWGIFGCSPVQALLELRTCSELNNIHF